MRSPESPDADLPDRGGAGGAGTGVGSSGVDTRSIARARFETSARVPLDFFEANADRIAHACRDLARAFHAGGRLLVFGEGAQWSDALHVAVEFVHPVIVGKRALPAIALDGDPMARLRALAEPSDVVLGIAADGGASLREPMAYARSRGLATIALTGPGGGALPADHRFAVDHGDAFVVQEVLETLYHVLWEQVHVFLDHPGTLR